jgi:release factor glutamine methyltransferase
MTISEANQQLVQYLQTMYDNAEALNMADMVLEKLTSRSRIDRLIYKEEVLHEQQQQKLEAYIQALLQHKPVQQVLEEAWFGKYKFFVNEHVLIPRPETEELVQEVVNYYNRLENFTQLTILDIGTGSGCIPITIKKELANATVLSVDVSKDALAVAEQNAIALHADVELKELNFLDESSWQQLGIFDVIVSNPPYIKLSESKTMQTNVLAFEPHIALFVPDEDALIFYRKIALFAQTHLNAGGKIFVEINEALGKETIELFDNYGYTCLLKKDMQGKDRMVIASI